MSKILCRLGRHRNTRTEPYMGVLNEDIGTCVVCNHCDKILEIHFTMGHTIRAPSIRYLVFPLAVVLGFALVVIFRFYLSGGG